ISLHLHFYSVPLFFLMTPPPPRSTLFPYTTLFRSLKVPPVLRKYHFLASAAAVGSWSHTREPAKLTRKSPVMVSPALATQLLERSEEHTSELQSPYDLVCRLLLEKKKK